MNKQDHFSMTPLMLATKNEHTEVCYDVSIGCMGVAIIIMLLCRLLKY